MGAVDDGGRVERPGLEREGGATNRVGFGTVWDKRIGDSSREEEA